MAGCCSCCNCPASPLPPTAESTIPTNGGNIIEWAKSYADIVTMAASLGGSLTFTVIVSDIVDPKRLNPDGPAVEARFDKETVRQILAIAWLLFGIAFGWAIMMSFVVRLASPRWIASYNRYNKSRPGHEAGCNRVRWLTALHSLGLGFLITAPYMCLGLAVWAYVEPVGLAAVVFISAQGGGIVVGWFLRV